jgi:hypothetical protein
MAKEFPFTFILKCRLIQSMNRQYFFYRSIPFVTWKSFNDAVPSRELHSTE